MSMRYLRVLMGSSLVCFFTVSIARAQQQCDAYWPVSCSADGMQWCCPTDSTGAACCLYDYGCTYGAGVCITGYPSAGTVVSGSQSPSPGTGTGTETPTGAPQPQPKDDGDDGNSLFTINCSVSPHFGGRSRYADLVFLFLAAAGALAVFRRRRHLL